jgi:DNA-binding MarR family transcriptional regulator
MIDIYKCFNITSKHASVFLEEKFSKFELCSGHRVFVKRIYENPGITRDQIKNIAHVLASNVTRAIDYMEEKGYITPYYGGKDEKPREFLITLEQIDALYGQDN